jgi:hypothetical protein
MEVYGFKMFKNLEVKGSLVLMCQRNFPHKIKVNYMSDNLIQLS